VRRGRVSVARNVVLDGRLALFHKRQRWLAVADLHFGYEISQRAAGNLFPLWGMQTIEARLQELIGYYHPTHLVLLGDLVHDRAGGREFRPLIARLRAFCEIVLIMGNHDRCLAKDVGLVGFWRSDGYYFHHGDCGIGQEKRIQIIGHHHPAGTVRDGAGLRLRLPAFVQQDSCWILPAFSPWAAGTEWQQTQSGRIWLCSPERVLQFDPGSAEPALSDSRMGC
jgi:putative SbcD/Mre11-related phosphoesterase